MDRTGMTRTVFWGVAGAGKSALCARLLAARHAAGAAGRCEVPGVQLADPFEGDVPIVDLVQASRGAALALVVIEAGTEDAERQAARWLCVQRQALVPRLVVAVNKMDLLGGDLGAFRGTRARFLRGWTDAPAPALVPVSARTGEGLDRLSPLLLAPQAATRLDGSERVASHAA